MAKPRLAKMQRGLYRWYKGETNIQRRTVHRSCWCIFIALFRRHVGLAGSALLSSGDLPASSDAEMYLARNWRIHTQSKTPGVQKILCLGSTDWIQIQVLLKAKLLKWGTEYTNFFILVLFGWFFFFARYGTMNENTADEFLFCHYCMLFFLSSLDEVSVFHPNNSPEHWSAALKSIP